MSWCTYQDFKLDIYEQNVEVSSNRALFTHLQNFHVSQLLSSEIGFIDHFYWKSFPSRSLIVVNYGCGNNDDILSCWLASFPAGNRGVKNKNIIAAPKCQSLLFIMIFLLWMDLFQFCSLHSECFKDTKSSFVSNVNFMLNMRILTMSWKEFINDGSIIV